MITKETEFTKSFLIKLKDEKLTINPQRAIELTKTMYDLHFELPDDPQVQQVLLKMNAEQQELYDLLYRPGVPTLKSGLTRHLL